MFKIINFIAKDKIRRMKKIIIAHKLLTILTFVSITYFLYTFSMEDMLFLKSYVQYAPWIITVYLGLKLINPTQEVVIAYQLIELKLITRREFKILLAIKLYGVGFIMAILNIYLREKIFSIFFLLNCAVNVYVFLRSSKKTYKIDLFMIVYVCISIYLNSLFLTGIAFALLTIIFVCLKMVRYEVLLPFYHVMYKLNLRYSGDIFIDTESDEISTEVERLFGEEKNEPKSWCQDYFENNYKFYWMKEIARISYDKEGYFLRIMISFLICVSAFYLPEWYSAFAVAICVFTAYDFCQNMFREDVKLFPYGFINPYKFGMILKTKLPVYTVACFIIFLPMILVLNQYSWSIACISILMPILGITKSFFNVFFIKAKLKK